VLLTVTSDVTAPRIDLVNPAELPSLLRSAQEQTRENSLLNRATKAGVKPAGLPALKESLVTLASDATQLAVSRTRLAYERTLMAWVRTATSLISFGFAIDKFFEGLKGGEEHRHLLGVRTFSLVMICVGLVSLVLATVQHQRSLHELKRNFGKQPVSLALVLSILIAGLGIFGLLAVVTQ
jgi:putative membrane protein